MRFLTIAGEGAAYRVPADRASAIGHLEQSAPFAAAVKDGRSGAE
jgi:hypothetical protein